MRTPQWPIVISLSISLLLATLAFADDWPQFRGPLGKGQGDEQLLPIEWSREKNVRWRCGLPAASNSSPIVSNGRVFVTVAELDGKKRSLWCLDRNNGERMWSQSVVYSEEEQTHKTNPYCGSTPCADGERVVVWHGSAGLHCYQFDGTLLWRRDLGPFDHIGGYGASPVLWRNLVFLNGGPGDRTYLVALDKETGDIIWQQNEEDGDSEEWIGSWATPMIVNVEGKDQLVIGFPGHVKGYDPGTGELLWTCGGLSGLVYADIVVSDGIAIATGENEEGESIGFRLGGRGDVTASNRLWAKERSMEVSTGVIVDRHLWTVDDDGILRATDIESGEVVIKQRAKRGPAWGSLLSANGHVYYTSKSGETVVFRADTRGPEIIQVNTFDEPSNSTPAFSDGKIFLRTHAAVYCIAE